MENNDEQKNVRLILRLLSAENMRQKKYLGLKNWGALPKGLGFM
jgi:hypothetical protein